MIKIMIIIIIQARPTVPQRSISVGPQPAFTADGRGDRHTYAIHDPGVLECIGSCAAPLDSRLCQLTTKFDCALSGAEGHGWSDSRPSFLTGAAGHSRGREGVLTSLS
jgi:hypothetical protein